MPFAVKTNVNELDFEAGALLIVNVVMLALFVTLNTVPLFRLMVRTFELIDGALNVSAMTVVVSVPLNVALAAVSVPVNVGLALSTIEPVPVTELERVTPP